MLARLPGLSVTTERERRRATCRDTYREKGDETHGSNCICEGFQPGSVAGIASFLTLAAAATASAQPWIAAGLGLSKPVKPRG